MFIDINFQDDYILLRLRYWIIVMEIMDMELYILSFECCFVNSKNRKPYFMEGEKITFKNYY